MITVRSYFFLGDYIGCLLLIDGQVAMEAAKSTAVEDYCRTFGLKPDRFENVRVTDLPVVPKDHCIIGSGVNYIN